MHYAKGHRGVTKGMHYVNRSRSESIGIHCANGLCGGTKGMHYANGLRGGTKGVHYVNSSRSESIGMHYANGLRGESIGMQCAKGLRGETKRRYIRQRSSWWDQRRSVTTPMAPTVFTVRYYMRRNGMTSDDRLGGGSRTTPISKGYEKVTFYQLYLQYVTVWAK